MATDKDDEGGAIAFNILRLSRALKYKKIERAYPSALDKQAIVRQFKNLEPIDSTWGQAQAGIARSRSDWLIGINLSRLYTGKLQSIGINGNYAIGRAISTTLNLICQWYEEIANFKEEPIYELRGNTQIGGDDVELRSTIRVVGQEGHDAKQEYLSLLHKNGLTRKHVTGRVVTVNSQPKQQQPPLMMTKGDLYKEMTRVAGWTQQRSKKVMQQNYEQGYQTYPRTDSGKITRHMYDYLGELFDDYLNAINLPGKFSKYSYDDKQFRRYLTTEKSAGAHLGIIPTEKLMTPEADVTDDQRLMWEVVVRKALTLWVNPYTYVSNRLGVQITDTLGMVAQNSVMTYEGWHKILLPSRKGKKKKKSLKAGVDFSQHLNTGDQISIVLKHEVGKTKPLSPLKSIQIYDRGGLMEKAYKYVGDEKYARILKETNGIGTSATRDQAMSSLVQKGYVNVDKKDIITVTPAGWLINHLLETSDVNKPILTAKWEEQYTLIEKGKTSANDLINQTAKIVYSEFENLKDNWNPNEIQDYYQELTNHYNEEISIGECPKCGSTVIFENDNRHEGKYDAYRCTNKECDFAIYYHFSNKTISKSNAVRLLSGKPTTLIKNIEARAGKTYDAQLQLIYDENKSKYRLEYYKSEANKPKRPKGFRKNRHRRTSRY